MPDPGLAALHALRRLRRIETDMARRDLAEAGAAEAALDTRLRGLNQELDAARQEAGMQDREAFAAWVARLLRDRDGVARDLISKREATAAARAALAHRRLAETAAEEVLAQGLAVEAAARARGEQLELEDVARALKRREQ